MELLRLVRESRKLIVRLMNSSLPNDQEKEEMREYLRYINHDAIPLVSRTKIHHPTRPYFEAISSLEMANLTIKWAIENMENYNFVEIYSKLENAFTLVEAMAEG